MLKLFLRFGLVLVVSRICIILEEIRKMISVKSRKGLGSRDLDFEVCLGIRFVFVYASGIVERIRILRMLKISRGGKVGFEIYCLRGFK